MGTAWSDLVDAIESAEEALDEARERLAAVRGTDGEPAARAAVEAAEAALAEAEAAYAAYDGPRPWIVVDADFCEREELEECTLEEAREYARRWLQEGHWDGLTTSESADVAIHDPITDEQVDYFSITIHPPEPPCSRGRESHDWVRPHEIVGGDEENPGVRVCLHCRRIWVEDAESEHRAYYRAKDHELGDRIRAYLDARKSA